MLRGGSSGTAPRWFFLVSHTLVGYTLKHRSDELDQQVGNAHEGHPAEARRAEGNKETETETSRDPLSRGSTPSSLHEMDLSGASNSSPQSIKINSPVGADDDPEIVMELAVGEISTPHPSVRHAGCGQIETTGPYPTADLVCS